jgi:ubiquitin C-terminal hydrolase
MEYHHKLVLSPRYISDTLRSEGLKNSYELQGVVLHHGENSTEGHYSSYVKDESGHWWHANDTDISWMSEDDVLMAEDKVRLV